MNANKEFANHPAYKWVRHNRSWMSYQNEAFAVYTNMYRNQDGTFAYPLETLANDFERGMEEF